MRAGRSGLGVRWSRRTDRRIAFAALAVVFVAGLAVFAYFASVVVNFPGEVRVSAWVQSWRTPWLDALMRAISWPGSFYAAVPLVLVASAAAYVKRWRLESAILLFGTIAGRLAAFGLKEWVARPRPPEDLVQVLQETGSYSFPSGHVMHYATFLGIIVFVLNAKIGPTAAVRAAQGALVLALLAIGLSRIYLGMHWLGDVMGGYGFGVSVVFAAAWVRHTWANRRSPASRS